MKVSSASLASLVFVLSATAASQTPILDSYESGDLSANHTSGLNWASPNRTSLVKHDPNLGDMVIYNGNPVEIIVGFTRDWKAIDGDVSMRFRYPSGTNSMAEQRFSLDTAYPEIWISYWLKVPINFRHGSNSPSNNKLFALWMDDYSGKGDGPTVAWEFWGDGSGGSRLAYHYSPGGNQIMGGHQQHTPFISYPDDQGRWMQIVIRAKASSNNSSNDGTIQLYRRWADEDSYTLFHNDTAADIAPPSGGPTGWSAGYFMGWSNPGYAQDTEWLLDDVVFSRSSLLGDSTPIYPPSYEPDPGDVGSCQPPVVPKILTQASL